MDHPCTRLGKQCLGYMCKSDKRSESDNLWGRISSGYACDAFKRGGLPIDFGDAMANCYEG